MRRILTFTSLYPNAIQPGNGIFVEQRLRHLLESGKVETRVVAPVPWFPLTSSIFQKYSKFARVPAQEERYGIDVAHPRYPIIPKIGMVLTPYLMARTMKPILKDILKSGYDFELIDAHYFYPDGVAAALLGKWLNKPVIITARGTDINLIPQYSLPRKMITWAAANCAGIITVCKALKDSIVDLGVPESHITPLRNGVDLDLFRPLNREQTRAKLGITGRTLLSVGYLIERKGHHLVIEALSNLPNTNLIIVGEGELEQQLKRQAQELGLGDRVRFAGAVDQKTLTEYYSAVDAMVLASSREGMANVLLESLACGNPVVANNCWGTPEVICKPEAGVLMERRDPESIVKAVNQLFDNYPARELTRKFAETFSWDETTRGQLNLFSKVLQ